MRITPCFAPEGLVGNAEAKLLRDHAAPASTMADSSKTEVKGVEYGYDEGLVHAHEWATTARSRR